MIIEIKDFCIYKNYKPKDKMDLLIYYNTLIL